MTREAIFVFAAILAFADATISNQCGTEIPQNSDQISMTNCDKPTCLLKHGTNVTIEIKIVPSRTIENVVNDVSGIISNVPLPFIGVDGTNACDNIYSKDGTKVGCPLQKGVEYIYRRSFPILSMYPKIEVIVHYALREGNDQLLCFEIPSKVVS